MTSKLVVNTIEADTGISSVSFASSISMNSTSKFHFSAAGVDIGADTNINRPAAGVLGFNVNGAEKVRIDTNGHMHGVGVVTATHFYGDGSNLTSLPVPTTITVADESSDTTCYPLYATATSGNLAPKTGTNLVFNSASGNLRAGSLFVGTATNESKTQDGLILERNSGDGEVHITAGRSGGNYSGMQFYVAGGSGVTKRFQIDYQSIFRCYAADGTTERLRIASDGRFGFGTSSPSNYALATFNSANGIQLQGDGQSRILLRNNTGGTNQKMMDIHCNGSINIRTINDDYTTATTRATFRTDGNFVVGNRVGTSSPSTNQPVAFHSARITPDTASSTVSNGVRCNLYVGSNSGWQAGDGGVIGMGGSRSGSAGQEAMWGYIKGSRSSGNGWEYAGKMELGTAEWGTYNTTKCVTLHADNQIDHHGKDNTMYSASIGGAVRVRLQHTGGGNMTLSNPSSGSFTFDTSSDYRLKENATTINNALTTVKALKPYQFTWKHDSKLGQGFFAHEAQEVLPDIGVVSGTKDAVQTEDDIKTDGKWKKDDPIYQGIDYSKLVPLLTAALQEETAKREALEARVAALEGS